LLKGGQSSLETFEDLTQLLGSSIVEDPPLTLKEGGIIKPHYDKELDSLREVAREGKGWILKLEAEERKKRGFLP
jgi:DNA mismatch repair protein MutS